MNLLVAGLILVGLTVVAGLALLLSSARYRDQSLPVTPEWIDEVSIERYRPMLRLLSRDDLLFLRDQPGFRPELETRARSQRCELFREYLRSLDGDFGRVCTALKLVMAQAAYDRPDLGAVLLRKQYQFAVHFWMARVQLLLYRWGCGSVDATELVRLFGTMHGQLRALVPAHMAAGA